ncbi:MAG TPA: cupin domain-containing protein [Stellaceae bacterium]|nr:cupin domain-containing protein [Stellaceae bacterium]
MKTTTISAAEMERRTARFGRLDSYQAQQAQAAGVPEAAFAQVAAHRVYPVLVPENYAGRSAQAPIKGAPGLAITIAECPPGNGAGLHAHEQSIENFFCLNGRFEIAWGDDGENSLVLEPMDLVSIPPGVCRSFKNIASETGRLLVVIQILTAEQADRVHYAPRVGAAIELGFGRDTLEALGRIGFLFDAGAPAA